MPACGRKCAHSRMAVSLHRLSHVERLTELAMFHVKRDGTEPVVTFAGAHGRTLKRPNSRTAPDSRLSVGDLQSHILQPRAAEVGAVSPWASLRGTGCRRPRDSMTTSMSRIERGTKA